jgi:hypothetical protein
MLSGLQFIVNCIVEVRSFTYVFMSNGSSVRCFNYKLMDQP